MKFSFLIIVFVLAVVPLVSAQTDRVKTTVATQKVERVEKKVEREVETQIEARRDATRASGDDFATERRANAAPDVALSLCVASGDVVVRGWDRAEVRARVAKAGGLKLDAGGGQPARRIEVIVAEDEESQESGGCGSTSTLELMVPRGASVTIQARDSHVEVSDVAEVHVQSLSGDVDVSRASKSVEVSCLSGDITLDDSSGPVRLAAISGNIEARNIRTVAQADSFEAKSTSGDVMLEGVKHSQVNGSTVSGGIIYTGALARGGVYDFRAISGDVTLELPADSSFNLHAKVVVGGDIVTDFPVKTLTGATPAPHVDAATAPQPAPPTNTPYFPTPPPLAPDVRRQGKMKPPKEPSRTRLDGTVGTGDAVVNLSSFNGSLSLKKR